MPENSPDHHGLGEELPHLSGLHSELEESYDVYDLVIYQQAFT